MKKRLLALTLAFVMCLAFAACGEKRDSPETVVSNGIDAVKSLDQKALAAYWDVESFDDLSGSDDSEETTQLMTLLVKNLSYKITSSEEKDSTATVSVEFTNLDMKSVMADVVSEAFSKMLGYAFLPEDQQPTEEETDAMFMEILTQLMDDNEYETVTASANMELTLKDDKWKISPTDDVLDAMFGGFVSFADEIGSDEVSDELIEYKSQIADFTLMLPEGFTEKSDNENVTCYFEGENELVTCLREPREDIISVAGKEELTLDEYAQLVIDANSLSSQIGKDDKGNTFFTYSQSVDNDEFFYYAVVKESDDAFWLFNFVCLQADKDTHTELFADWASRIEVATEKD